MSKFRDEFLKLPLVRRRLGDEAEGRPWWAVTARDGGAVHLPLFGASRPLFQPRREQGVFACDMAEALNRHIAHDGRWIVQLVQPVTSGLEGVPTVLLTRNAAVEYTEFRFVWLDRDGDPQFTHECDWPWRQWLLVPWTGWVAQAEEAHATWERMMRAVLEPERQGALFKRAQGEPAPSEPA